MQLTDYITDENMLEISKMNFFFGGHRMYRIINPKNICAEFIIVPPEGTDPHQDKDLENKTLYELVGGV